MNLFKAFLSKTLCLVLNLLVNWRLQRFFGFYLYPKLELQQTTQKEVFERDQSSSFFEDDDDVAVPSFQVDLRPGGTGLETEPRLRKPPRLIFHSILCKLNLELNLNEVESFEFKSCNMFDFRPRAPKVQKQLT